MCTLMSSEGLREAGRSSGNRSSSRSHPREGGGEQQSEMADRWVDLKTLYLKSTSIAILRAGSPVERCTSSPGCRFVGNQKCCFDADVSFTAQQHAGNVLLAAG